MLNTSSRYKPIYFIPTPDQSFSSHTYIIYLYLLRNVIWLINLNGLIKRANASRSIPRRICQRHQIYRNYRVLYVIVFLKSALKQCGKPDSWCKYQLKRTFKDFKNIDIIANCCRHFVRFKKCLVNNYNVNYLLIDIPICKHKQINTADWDISQQYGHWLLKLS